MSGATTWKAFSDQIWLNARRDCRPVTATFELTPLCNFRCRMCYVRLDESRVPEFGRLHSADEWLSLANQAMKMGLYTVTLSGGEPLLHPEFEKIYVGLSRMGLLVSILSNGSLLTEKHIALFRDYPPASVRFTLYGASNETYVRLCCAPKGFDRVMRSVQMLIDEDIPLSFAFTETSENVGDFDAVMNIARRFDRPIIVTSDLNCAVRGASSEAEQLRVELDERQLPNGNEVFAPTEIDEIVREAQAEGLLSGPFMHCRPYKTFFFVNWNGTMENCASMSYCRSLPFEWGFDAAWKDMQEKLSSLETPQACGACPDAHFCTACPGKRNAETHSPDGIPERYCAEARRRHEKWKEDVGKNKEVTHEEVL